MFRVNDYSAATLPARLTPAKEFPPLGSQEPFHDASMSSFPKKSKGKEDAAKKKRVEDAREVGTKESVIAERIGAGEAPAKAKENLSVAPTARGAAWSPPQYLHQPDR